MNIDQNKLAIQLSAKKLWIESGYKGTFEWATGTGKTYAAILSIKDIKGAKFIAVPSVYLKNQWESELKKHDIEAEVVVIDTIIKNKYETDVLVIDECHRFAATTFRNIFNVIKYNKILALTATIERTDMKHYILNDYCPVISKIPLKEALKLNLVPEFFIYNLSVNINPQERIFYDNLDKKFKNFFAFFNFDFNLGMNCLKYHTHRQLYSNITGNSIEDIRIKAINFNRLMAKRKEFIYFSEDKKDTVVKIVENFNTKKIIVFAERKKTLYELKKLIPSSEVYDPTKSEKVCKQIMEDFINNKFKILLTAHALDEGMNIPDIDIGIIHSGNSSKINAVQRLGRLLRKDEDKIPILINLYIENTQDEKWLKNRNKEIPNIYWIDNINLISYEPREEQLKEENRSDYFNKRVQLF